MSGERYTLDANILFYAMDADAGMKHLIAKRLWEGALHHDCVLTIQALGETFHAVSRKAPDRLKDARSLLGTLSSMVPTVAASAEDLATAMQARSERQIQFWDAMLWATAKGSGCTTIVNEDVPDRYLAEGVRYFHPFRATSEQILQYV